MEVLRGKVGRSGPSAEAPAVVTIGTFDAVHRGHQALFRRVVEEARRLEASPAVLTFDRHPIEVLAPEKAPCRLTTLDQRLALLEELGIERTLVLAFTRELASLEPEAFVEEVLVGWLGVRKVIVGADFRFGRARRGDVELLRELGAREGFEAEACELVEGEDGPVSSTVVRRLVGDGRIEAAAELLGRPFRLAGTVVHGAGRGGADLGFPTANLELHPLACLPGLGVYAGWWLWEGRRVPGAVNVGVRPTFTPDPEPVVEIHLLDFSEDLYGASGEIEFHSRLRDEVRFSSVEELIEQMREDVEEARRRLGS